MAIAEAWQDIRALRASPTGRATSARRKKTFGAALRQAEELAEAANAVGYAARPIPLFYSLSQAGRAITAAHTAGDWEPHGHGLRIGENRSSVLDSTAIPDAGGSFGVVAAAIGSPTLSGPAALGALWAANPDLEAVPIPAALGPWPRALDVPIGRQEPMRVHMGEPPQDPETSPLTTGGLTSVSIDLPGETVAEVVAATQPYPSLRQTFVVNQRPDGWDRAAPSDLVSRHPHIGSGERVHLSIEVPETTTQAAFWAYQRQFVSYTEPPEDRPMHLDGWFMHAALPEVAGGPSPHPLMCWWGLLLGLSSLARYEPAAWTGALDLDRSELAVGLERVLDVAAGAVPIRLLNALR